MNSKLDSKIEIGQTNERKDKKLNPLIVILRISLLMKVLTEDI